LDTRLRHEFDRVLGEVVGELKRLGFKLRMISKRYVAQTRFRTDSFWIARQKVGSSQLNLACTLTLSFGRGFEISCDMDFFLEFPLLAQQFRSRAKELMNPSLRSQRFVKEELDRAWRVVEEQIHRRIVEVSPAGWGQHSLPSGVAGTARICHLGEVVLDHASGSEALLKLTELRRNAEALASQLEGKISEAAEAAIQASLPPPTRDEAERAVLTALLKHPEGLLEYQLRRLLFLKYEMPDAESVFRRLELWGYIRSIAVPNYLRRRLESAGVRRYFRLLRPGERLPSGFQPCGAVKVGFEPISVSRVKRLARAPEHLVERAINNLCRRKLLRKIKTVDHRGERVLALVVRRWSKETTPLEMKVVKLVADHFREQGRILEECRRWVRSLEEGARDL
jgi:hypothetical protein